MRLKSQLHNQANEVLNHSLKKKSHPGGRGRALCHALGGSLWHEGHPAHGMTAKLSNSSFPVSRPLGAGTWHSQGRREVCLANDLQAHLQAKDATGRPMC